MNRITLYNNEPSCADAAVKVQIGRWEMTGRKEMEIEWVVITNWTYLSFDDLSALYRSRMKEVLPMHSISSLTTFHCEHLIHRRGLAGTIQ